MNTVGKFTAVAIASLSLMGTVAHAAVLTSADGTARVDSGAGFRSVSTVATVKPGDIIAAGVTGKTVLLYDNGCAVALKPGQTASVMKKAPSCSSTTDNNKNWSGRMGVQNVAPPVPVQSVVPAIVGIGASAAVFGFIGFKVAKSISP